MRLKFQSTLKEQYDLQRVINHKAMLLVDAGQLEPTLG